MDIKIKKMNNFLVNKGNRMILSLILLIVGMSIMYIFFLFMSVSYTYAAKNNSLELNNIFSKNVEKKTQLFDKERNDEQIFLENKFVKLDRIDYVKNSDVLVVNLKK